MKKVNMGDSHLLIDIINQEFPRGNCIDIAEIGVFRGGLSRKLLESFPGSKLWMVDWWSIYHNTHSYRQSRDVCAAQTDDQQKFNRDQATKVAYDFGDRVSLFADGSVNAAMHAFRSYQTFDVVFIDASHVYEDVVVDLDVWFPLVRKFGGILAGHDMDHPRDKRGAWGVRRAVERFCRDNLLEFKQSGTCWWIKV